MDLNLKWKVSVVTGGGGAICGEIATALAREGSIVAIWDLSSELALKKAREIEALGGKCIPLECDVLDRQNVKSALEKTLSAFQTVDILINGAGGSRREATTSSRLAFFDIDPDVLCRVMHLNYLSAVIPSQEVGRIFAEKKAGVILNISSVAGIRPLTRAIAYSNGKAATNSFTRWLAVYMAQNFSPSIRVNAIAPGFVLTEQNRFLLLDQETGKFTRRGEKILRSTPMKRLGEPSEIVGAALWLVSNMASFITGAVVPVDGGFTAYSGV
jgi:NAD(P)-dependent dehydrogenase (short-subunit alcohol dehydrogenase family)